MTKETAYVEEVSAKPQRQMTRSERLQQAVYATLHDAAFPIVVGSSRYDLNAGTVVKYLLVDQAGRELATQILDQAAAEAMAAMLNVQRAMWSSLKEEHAAAVNNLLIARGETETLKRQLEAMQVPPATLDPNAEAAAMAAAAVEEANAEPEITTEVAMTVAAQYQAVIIENQTWHLRIAAEQISDFTEHPGIFFIALPRDVHVSGMLNDLIQSQVFREHARVFYHGASIPKDWGYWQVEMPGTDESMRFRQFNCLSCRSNPTPVIDNRKAPGA